MGEKRPIAGIKREEVRFLRKEAKRVWLAWKSPTWNCAVFARV